jgi:hypothetical protein
MQTSGKIPGTGFLFIAIAALMLSGCVAAGVATVAAGGGLGYALGQEEPETTASAAPAGGSDLTVEPAAAGALDPWGQPVAQSEPLDMGQPAVLVEPQSPVEAVEVQPIQ